jgi:hypothetical protein
MAKGKPAPVHRNDDLQKLNHFISRKEAKTLLDNFKKYKTKMLQPDLLPADKELGVLPYSEAFNEKTILAILSQPGCVGIRIHYGVKLKQFRRKEVPLLVAVLVGVNQKGANMWSASRHKMAIPEGEAKIMLLSAKDEETADGCIAEDAQRCPPYPSSEVVA